jgi:hypothetical protein
MTPPRFEPLVIFWDISKRLSDAQEGFAKGAIKESEFLIQFAEALRQYNGGVREAFRYAFERIERVHQKLDRIEAKIGSVPHK